MTLAVTLCTLQVFFFFTDIIQCKQNMHMFWVSGLLSFHISECKLCILTLVWCLEWVKHSGINWINCAQTLSGCASEYGMWYRLYIELARLRKVSLPQSRFVWLAVFTCLHQLSSIPDIVWPSSKNFQLVGKKSRIEKNETHSRNCQHRKKWSKNKYKNQLNNNV